MLRALASSCLAALVALTAGCGAVPKRPEDPGLFLLPPASGGRELSIEQSVRIEKKEGEPFETLAAVELDAHSLKVAALGPLGNRILYVEWDGEHYSEERDPHMPKEFPLMLVLRDLELSLFPAAAVRKALPSGWYLQEKPRQRVLLHEQKPVIVIDYSADDPFHSDVDFKHLVVGYHLVIRAVES